MQRLKKFIHEVHRRSLWQVLGIYVIGGWLVLQVVDTLAGALNLPEWAPPLALFLLIIGLPIVLATAFVQEGVGRREALGADPGEVEHTAGGTPIPSFLSPPGGAHHRLLTWRNAIIGGVVAFAVWGVVATIWIALGSGIGVDTASAADLRSVAVLPFASVHTDEESQAFTNGIHDDLLTQLSRSRSGKLARPSSWRPARFFAVAAWPIGCSIRHPGSSMTTRPRLLKLKLASSSCRTTWTRRRCSPRPSAFSAEPARR